MAIHYCALEGFNGFHETLQEEFEKDNEKASQYVADIYLEYVLLYMHLMSRKAFGLFGPEGRSILLEAIVPYVATLTGSYFEGDNKQLVSMITREASDSEDQYRNYDLSDGEVFLLYCV